MSDEIINQLTERIQRLKDGYEGCCTACEPVGEMNQKLRQEVEQLRKERDEARRLYCRAVEEIEHGMTNETEHMVADYLGWDCFNDNKNA
jgi:archaellum component FlaC